ncbi:MAG: N-acetylmuramoyl-L-alanine amidase [Cyanobacteria bacterium P01_D01_bin.1]
MRLNRLLPGLSLMGALLIALPSEAARLQSWQFSSQANQLTFTTDDDIQPTAQLLSNPTRLVIDLPGTTLEAAQNQTIAGPAIKEVRTIRLDAETARLVVEYEPGYTVNPSQVQVRGQSSRRWTVQLPEATNLALNNSQATPNSEPSSSEAPNLEARSNTVSNRPVQGARTRIQGIVATVDGFFIRTAGETAQVEVNRFSESGQNYIALELDQAAVSLGLTAGRLPVDRYSIDQWQVEQTSTQPARARITLALGEDSPDWDIAAHEGGITVLPKDVAITSVPDNGNPAGTTEAYASTLATANRQAEQVDPNALPTVPNGRFTVVLDPGHGGRDPGAVGIGGLQEKQVVNDVTPQVAALLRSQGVNVVLTRDSDYELDLAPRVQIAERANATIFVSIHANAISMSRPDVNGLETFYASAAGQRLANTVHASVLAEMGMRDRRVRSARFYVIRNTSMPAILVETGFVTGAEDAPNLANPAWRERMSVAIARGILLHLQQGL